MPAARGSAAARQTPLGSGRREKVHLHDEPVATATAAAVATCAGTMSAVCVRVVHATCERCAQPTPSAPLASASARAPTPPPPPPLPARVLTRAGQQAGRGHHVLRAEGRRRAARVQLDAPQVVPRAGRARARLRPRACGTRCARSAPLADPAPRATRRHEEGFAVQLNVALQHAAAGAEGPDGPRAALPRQRPADSAACTTCPRRTRDRSSPRCPRVPPPPRRRPAACARWWCCGVWRVACGV